LSCVAGTARAVLFDLDGTLIDSAPDLAGAANDMRSARGLALLPLAHFRPMVGSGARGMVDRALGVQPHDPEFGALRDEFLRRYERRMTLETTVFPEFVPLLTALCERAVPWAIVTNKATRFSVPLVAALSLLRGAATLVCGDTTPHAKPHPAPLLEAARRIGFEPGQCVYVGDDLRDVQAGRAAGMSTVAVRWGYLGAGEPVEAWGADHIIDSPMDLLKLLSMP
jgi:2-phosphoglycolate phosphatase